MRTCCRRARSRNSSFHSGARPAWRARSSRCFCIDSARKEQKTWPRMAASDEWKIGRVRMIALVRKKRFSTCSKMAIAEHGLQRRRFRVGPQHEDSIETRLFGELSSVDLERTVVLGFANLAQIPSIGRVADERLVAFLQLRVERSDNRLAILAVLFQPLLRCGRRYSACLRSSPV